MAIESLACSQLVFNLILFSHHVYFPVFGKGKYILCQEALLLLENPELNAKWHIPFVNEAPSLYLGDPGPHTPYLRNVL